MNFLSHIYLSGNSKGLILGNFIADSIKGSELKKFTSEIQQGIILHRKIDVFTDSHPTVEQSKVRLRDKYRKYSSVIVDIYYDHFLAINWEQYSTITLKNYTQLIYQLLEEHLNLLPKKSMLFKKYMVQYDVLFNYSSLKGIEKVLYGMSQRASFVSNMEHSIQDLIQHFDLFETEFKTFFPELQTYVKNEIEFLKCNNYIDPIVL